jgi:hypothetical protein
MGEFTNVTLQFSLDESATTISTLALRLSSDSDLKRACILGTSFRTQASRQQLSMLTNRDAKSDSKALPGLDVAGSAPSSKAAVTASTVAV